MEQVEEHIDNEGDTHQILELGHGQHHQTGVTLGSGARGVVEHVMPFRNVFKTSNFAM